MDNGTWKEHSSLNEVRISHSTVSTETATYVFGGGQHSSKTYEYLLKDSTTWLMGKTEIPGGFTNGFAILVRSGQEIWLIGGRSTEKRILSFNTNDHTFRVLPFRSNEMRTGHRCAFIPNTNKVMITGGELISTNKAKPLKSTEIIDTVDGSVYMASPMKFKRVSHGMGTITINGEDRLAVFGGFNGRTMRQDSVELYNTETREWETTNIKLKEPKGNFGFLSIKLSEIISNF